MLFVSAFTGICAGGFLCLAVPQQPGCLHPHPGPEVAQATGQGWGGAAASVGQSLTPLPFFLTSFPGGLSEEVERDFCTAGFPVLEEDFSAALDQLHDAHSQAVGAPKVREMLEHKWGWLLQGSWLKMPIIGLAGLCSDMLLPALSFHVFPQLSVRNSPLDFPSSIFTLLAWNLSGELLQC